MTIKQSSLFVIAALALGAISGPSDASAQADVRDLRPAMILMVDTSGSMERLPSCTCTTPSCDECLPQCSGTPGAGDERNRWATVLEALTGSWNDSTFACSAVSRASFGGDDATYPLPHYTNPGVVGQDQDGILDTYAARAKFALMTFDGVPTLINGPELVPVTDYYSTYAIPMRGAAGGYSYGTVMETPWRTDGAPSYPFLFPGCTQPGGYFINVGAKRAISGSETLSDIPGSLLTVGADSDYISVNSAIQSSLLAVRPSGPTPIAGMLEDLRHYLANDSAIGPADSNGNGDPYFNCRKRYGLLITDGYPNADMRGAPFHCETATSPGGYPTGRSSWCPYDLPQQIAAQLCSPSGAQSECAASAPLDGLFVVGFNVDDDAAAEVLNAIALSGGTQEAYFATDLDSLRDAIAEIINVAAAGTTSRTTPAFSTPSLAASSQSASQFSTGFLIDDPGEPWTGVLTRTRFECEAATNTAERQSVEDRDRFHTILNANASRRLLTVVPTDPAHVTGHLIGTTNGVSPLASVSVGGTNGGGAGSDGAGGVSCENGSVGPSATPAAVGTQSDLVLEPFTVGNADIGRDHFSVATDADRDAIINWVRGDNNARSARLGDIYHSSPAVVGAPGTDISDEAFNEYRRSPVVANRPTVVYVGSNDGVLHAFAAENMTISDGPYANRVVTAGQEIWGFVPPAVFPRLNAARSSHQWLVDGTPIVKDVFYSRAPQGAASATTYHTVLLIGLRGGGGAYIALDVTDPFEPKFLWQFTHPDLGETYGTPALGQAVVEVSDNVYQERAVAFLPGGAGDDITLSCSGLETVNSVDRLAGCEPNGRLVPETATGSIDARSRVRCWRERGRSMFVVDPATGQLIKHLDDRVFSSPITGGVALFTGSVGTISSRAYFTDADGVIWRMEFSSADLDEWRASPVFDMFHGAGGAQGQPSYGPPVLSTDLEGNVVVIQGTGDVDTLDGDSTVSNRITSVTDVATFAGSGAGTATFGVNLNWEVVLQAGEVVTGPIQLFDGKVYFATFRSASSTDACAFGRGYLWGLDYRLPSSGYVPTGILPSGTPVGSTTVANIEQNDNELILGLAVTQDLTCADWNDETRFDPYVPSASASVTRAGQVNRGGFRLVAQISGGATTNGAVQEMSYDLTAPVSATRIQGWAGHAD